MRSFARFACAAALVALSGCGAAKGISSRMARGDKPGSDPFCQVFEGGGGLRPGNGLLIAMRVGNDRACTWGFVASGFGPVEGVSRASHGASFVEGSGGRVLYQYRAAPGYVGSDRFTFALLRGDGYDNPVTVNVDVVPAP